jgi:hypothetical protein
VTEYGIWSNGAGGFIETGIYDLDEANAALDEWPPEEEAEVLEICSEHEEQPAIGCEECAEEESEVLDE